MEFLSSFLGCHFAGKAVMPCGREMTAVFSGYLSATVSKIGVFVKTFLTKKTKLFGGKFQRNWDETLLKCTTLQLKHLMF